MLYKDTSFDNILEDIDKTVCFTGHRTIPYEDIAPLFQNIVDELLKLINKGYDTFICGGATGFDNICEKLVLNMKKVHPHIKLILALPCKDQAKYWSKEQKEEYENIKAESDEIIYTSEYYHNGCMHKRNRYMVDNSSYCICYLNKNSGGTFYTVNYAKEKGLTVKNLYTNR